MRRRSHRSSLLLLGVFALAVFGGWQMASGSWIHAKAWVAQQLLEAAWDQIRAGEEGAIARPWPWADTWPVARLHFPRLGASFIVLAGDSGSSLAFGPGHSGASAPPGRPGTAVISGHRDTHFRWLAHLRAGDRIEVERPDGARVAYRVAALEIADTRRDRLAAAAPHYSAARPRFALALVTCWPFDAIQPGGPLRYVVSAYGVGNAVENEVDDAVENEIGNGVGSGGRHTVSAKSRIPAHFTQPPQALRRKTGSQPRFTSFAQVPLRPSRVGPPTLRHTSAESTGSGTEPRAMPPRRVHDIRRTGQQLGLGHPANAQRNSSHSRATVREWIGWKETTTRALHMRPA